MGRRKLTYEFVQEKFEKESYTLLSNGYKNAHIKLDILERDAYVCLNTYCTSKAPNDLTIHHIDYNKKNCHPSNLITVCRSCNGRANKDRRWYKAWYQAIMYRRYSYDYN